MSINRVVFQIAKVTLETGEILGSLYLIPISVRKSVMPAKIANNGCYVFVSNNFGFVLISILERPSFLFKIIVVNCIETI